MNILSLFQPIKVFIFDIDGVLTNGKLLLAKEGMLRVMNVKDGFALQWAIKNEYDIVVISGGNSALAKERLEKLGIDKVFIGVSDKIALLKQLVSKHHWQKEEMLFMGDDLPDRDCLQFCGLSTCPADAVDEIRNLCDYVSPKQGGDGAVRDVMSKVMKLQGKWPIDF